MADLTAVAATMRKDALEVFDGPECPQEVRDAINYCYSLLLDSGQQAEPTEAMLNAARDWSKAKYGIPIGNDAAIGCWKAMYAALAGHQSERPAPAGPDMRAVCEALGFDPTNHHNAAKCPYCRPAPEGQAVGERGRMGVALSLLTECLGPLEVSAAVIESEDGNEAIDTLIAQVRKFVADARALASSQAERPAEGGNV